MEAKETTYKSVKVKVRWAVVLLLLLLVSGELFARFYLGLGTPTLSVTDPEIGFMFKPNQEISRFGNRFKINQFGMRSDDFPLEKTDKNSIRIMVFGDSVLNGGGLTDQSELATSLLEAALTKEYGKKVVVGNISAGGWGPEHYLAYARRYGFFNADVVVVLVSSNDYFDVINSEPLNPNTHPTSNPFSALTEGVSRYLPRYFGFKVKSISSENGNVNIKDIERSKNALKNLLLYAKNTVKNVIVLQHLDTGEIKGSYRDGFSFTKKICDDVNIKCVSLENAYKKYINSGVYIYRDNIHLNSKGQMVIYEVLNSEVNSLMKK